MNLFIDKENMLSLKKNFSRDSDGKNGEYNPYKSKYIDCLRKFHIYFNFGMSSGMNGDGCGEDDKNNSHVNKEEEIQLDLFIRNYLTLGKAEVEKNTYLNDSTKPQYPKSFTINDVQSDMDYLSSVYLVENPEEGLENIVLCGKPGEETKVLDRLFCGNEFNQFKFLQSFSWNDLGENIPPCTDIVICDRYLFADNDEVVKKNLHPMLHALFHNTKTTVNIVILTMDKYDNVFFGDSRVTQSSIEEAIKFIKDVIKENTGMPSNVTFIVDIVNKDEPKVLPHDRAIISNYNIILSGDSFLYFNFKGSRKTKGYFLAYSSLVESENKNFADAVIDSLNKNYLSENDYLIYGDKVSNFLEDLDKESLAFPNDDVWIKDGKEYQGIVEYNTHNKKRRIAVLGQKFYLDIGDTNITLATNAKVTFTAKKETKWIATNIELD